jgi:hypothetical protein
LIPSIDLDDVAGKAVQALEMPSTGIGQPAPRIDSGFP